MVRAEQQRSQKIFDGVIFNFFMEKNLKGNLLDFIHEKPSKLKNFPVIGDKSIKFS